MTTQYLDQTIADRLEEKLSKLNSLRPLPKSAVEKLKGHLRMEMTYNSNAIEGNSLTLRETFLIINEGVTVKGKPLKDHLEAQDHHSALQYLYELVEIDTHNTISEQLIRSFHQLTTLATDKEWAGVYRNANVIITGTSHQPPDALEVPHKMQELIIWLRESQAKIHIVELAALLHHRIVHIHPFFDGNGRTSRLLMNVLLMQQGFPLTIILKNDRKKYYRVLAQADQGNVKPLALFIAQAVERTLDIYLKTLTPVTENREEYLPLSALAKHTSYSAKYLNLLIRKGKLAGHKEGRIWLSTINAVNVYI
ncbi:MAG: Fic family protein, partial [Desulfobulbaceae bacterium]|nr:Fic family protein [Desulfobulbaceae bacterium]